MPFLKLKQAPVSHVLEFEGANYFRQRIIQSLLSSRPIRIINIRPREQNPGLHDFEANLLRLIDAITNGTKIEVNQTGYYLEVLLFVGPFCKLPLRVTLNGVTNNQIDPSPDQIKYSMLPLLKRYYIDEGLELKINRRGMPLEGGGQIYFTCPVKRSLKPMQFTDPGLVKRIRGVAYGCRVSPATATRILEAAKAVLTNFVPDVYIYSDHRRGDQAGNSPGFGITLVAETTKEVYYTAEVCSNSSKSKEPSVPEFIGEECAEKLLDQIFNGGCVDDLSQSLAFQYMILCPKDVCKILVGEKLTPYSIQYLKHIKEFFGIMFKIDEVRPEAEDTVGVSVNHMMTCVGSGFTNLNKTTL
ncbi:RNA 3'-terminal phosphate cyclase-like protein [Symsagittifera roscoffensis]|uniref:RNA 3'-terminal phosphate cyclase-like protein n=1 Tax=Symsagittifera roscoffensis TaxID=84072 RepID=UPI00307B7DA6